MSYPPQSRSPFRTSDITVFLAGLALLFFLWFGIHLLALRLAVGNLQRPYGCLPRDIVCVDQHRQRITSRVWLAYLVTAPLLAGLATRQVAKQERRLQRRRRR